MSYQKVAGHQSPSGAGSTARGQGTEDSLSSTARDTGTEPSKATQPEPRGSTGRELQGKASTAPAYGCSLAKLDVWTEEIGSQFDSHFWGSMLRVPRRQGQHCPMCSKACGREWPWFESPFVLCISLTQPNVANSLWKKTTTQQLAPPFTLPHSLEEQQRNVLSCDQYS